MITIDLNASEEQDVLHINSEFQLLKLPIRQRIKSAQISGQSVTTSHSEEDNITASYIYLAPELFQHQNYQDEVIYLIIELENGENFSIPLKIQYDVEGIVDAIRKKRAWVDSILDPNTRIVKNRPNLVPGSASSAELKTDHVSTNPYNGLLSILFDDADSTLGVDVGAGVRETSSHNIVNVEIFDYPSTDIIAFGNKIPVKDNSFDFAMSIAVLEHVPNPFEVAAEIQRIVKPGGRILVAIPFLQHLHGYPYHFFNATTKGIEQLFVDCELEERFQDFSCHPIHTVNQVITDYFFGLDAKDRDVGKKFLDLRLSEVAGIIERRDEEFLNVSDDCMQRIAHANYCIFKIR